MLEVSDRDIRAIMNRELRRVLGVYISQQHKLLLITVWYHSIGTIRSACSLREFSTFCNAKKEIIAYLAIDDAHLQ